MAIQTAGIVTPEIGIEMAFQVVNVTLSAGRVTSSHYARHPHTFLTPHAVKGDLSARS